MCTTSQNNGECGRTSFSLSAFFIKLPAHSRVGDLPDPVSLTSTSSGKGLSVAWFSGDIQSLSLLPQVGHSVLSLSVSLLSLFSFLLYHTFKFLDLHKDISVKEKLQSDG